MAKSFTPFLMFEGHANAAMDLYLSVFEHAEVRFVERYGPGEPGPEGSVKLAMFALGEQQFLCSDSFEKHAFSFTPSFSIFMECESEAELNRVYSALSEGGEVLMPLDNYGFSTRFGWVNDRFGVSWQLNLP
jgi:predicted 3-demethylubiquinone-9 3-methyltransferase (glyoxalase superfamily)